MTASNGVAVDSDIVDLPVSRPEIETGLPMLQESHRRRAVQARSSKPVGTGVIEPYLKSRYYDCGAVAQTVERDNAKLVCAQSQIAESRVGGSIPSGPIQSFSPLIQRTLNIQHPRFRSHVRQR